MFFSILGLIIGIILAYCYVPKVKYIGPDSNKVKNYIFKNNKGCYQFVPFAVVCGINSSNDL
jgi:hypothetical protein